MTSVARGLALGLAVGLAGCAGEAEKPAGGDEGRESAGADSTPLPASRAYLVRVTLDGAPAEGAVITQPGAGAAGTGQGAVTDANGMAAITVDLAIDGEIWVMAAHREARVGGVQVDGREEGEAPVLEIGLARYVDVDNEGYSFQHPGLEDWSETTTAHCSHCHADLFEAWRASPHRSSASNPLLWALYRGEAVGGGAIEGAYAAVGEDGGGCAACHAPGIDGRLSGRRLEEAGVPEEGAPGIAFTEGVHCDVCHRIDGVDMADAAPGVGGRVRLLRPSELSPSRALGVYLPLTFGPWPDVLNPRMGAVYRPEFHEAELCGGCHQLDQPSAADLSRWPEGRLPIHSTYAEWAAGPYAPGTPCQACHMPPDPAAWNGATYPGMMEGDSGDTGHGHAEPVVGWGVAGGWPRPPGSVRRHAFLGPRQGALIGLAASVSVERGVGAGGEVTARVTVRNVGAGHAIPTGEPLRALILRVEATCDGAALAPVGGDVLAEEAGFLEARWADDPAGWERWPGAAAGEVLRVVRQGEWADYAGPGRFGDGSFTVEQRGVRREQWAGEVEILSVGAGGDVLLSGPLPAGDRVYRLPALGSAGSALYAAGAPGWMFQRLLGAAGARGAPHHVATDVISDNRLMPGASWASEHAFAPCAGEASARAWLVHRSLPAGLAAAYGAEVIDQPMAEERR